METIGFIGGGNMAEALIKGILAAKLYTPEDILVSDIRAERKEYLGKEYRVQPVEHNKELSSQVDILVLSVKPQQMNEALNSIAGSLKQGQLVISIAAGIKTAAIAEKLGDLPIVRVMPNTPALIGEGASALFANRKAQPVLEKVERIFSAVGTTVVVDDEGLMDVVTAVSGSGPAYFFLFAEEMIAAAVELGLPEAVAKKLVLQTARGAAILAGEAESKGESLASLRRKVTSPGGTTEAAIKTFNEQGFGSLTAAAIKSACDRSRELSRSVS
ncbi:MAG: pyrroline-5-carboxylate reductase [Planctomycetota bacterium]